jgi:hypothetical protein
MLIIIILINFKKNIITIEIFFLDLKGKIKNYKNFVKKSKGKKKEIKSRITELKNIIYTN